MEAHVHKILSRLSDTAVGDDLGKLAKGQSGSSSKNNRQTTIADSVSSRVPSRQMLVLRGLFALVHSGAFRVCVFGNISMFSVTDCGTP